MDYSTQEQFCFHPVDGLTVRGSFDGGALSSDLEPLLLRGIDRLIGLAEQLANAFKDQRHSSYMTHSVKALFTQRIFQVASAYEDGNDANALRADPVFKLGLDRTSKGSDPFTRSQSEVHDALEADPERRKKEKKGSEKGVRPLFTTPLLLSK